MSIVKEATWAASPSTTRGLPTPLSADAKGEWLAYASGKSVFLRSIDNPAVSKQYTQHTTTTTVARFAPSGFYVASGDVSGSVRVWDAVGAENTKGEYHIIAGRINDIAWDGDSQRIIAVGDGKERFGHCITADSGNTVGEISGHSAAIQAVDVRKQRPLRAATASADTTVAFLHGAPFKFATSLRGQHSNFVNATAFSPDGSTLVSVGSDKRIWLYDGKTGEPQKQIGEGEHKGSIFGVSWAKDSKRFVTSSADQTVKIWDAEAGKMLQSWRLGGDDTAVSVPHQQTGVVWARDNLIISLDLEGNFNYFTPGESKPTKIVHGHQGNITAAALAQNTLWTGAFDGRVRTWDVTNGLAAMVDGQTHSNYVASIAPSSNGSRVYTTGWDDTLRTIDASTKTFLGDTSKLSSQPKGLCVTANDKVIIATAGGIDVFQNGKNSPIETKGYAATCAVYDSVSDHFDVGADDKALRIYSAGSGELQKEVKDVLSSAPSSLSVSPDGQYLAVGTQTGGISVLSTKDWSLVTARWSAHSARVTSVAWSSDSLFAASGSLDTHVHVWSLSKPGTRIKAANAHRDGVNAVVWYEAGGKRRVLSTGADATVKVWEVKVD